VTVQVIPELNTLLMVDLIRWAERDEEIDHQWWGTWDQSSWGWAVTEEDQKNLRNGACKTAYCMAGQAAHQAGYRLEFQQFDTIHREMTMHDGTFLDARVASASTCVQQRDTGRKTSKGAPIWEDVPDAESKQISHVGREALGLTMEEADAFFEGDNTLDRLKMMANWFCVNRGLPLLYPDWTIWAPDEDYDPDDDY
jgi:hypothetical protein